MTINKPTKEEQAKWEKILIGWNLGMFVGFKNQEFFGLDLDRMDRKFDYTPATKPRDKREGSKALVGKKHSAESIANMSAAQKIAGAKKKKLNKCGHSDLPNRGRRMCNACYLKDKRKRKKNDSWYPTHKEPMVNLCGCLEKPHHARGMCAAHYKQSQRDSNSRTVAHA